MPIDPSLLKQLIETFQVELDEKLQLITDGLLTLEKNMGNEQVTQSTVEVIFRASHNIKGTARSVGCVDIGEIAHHIESLFSAIQKKEKVITVQWIDLCFSAVDAMKSAMNSFVNNTPLDFNLSELVSRLEKGEMTKETSHKQNVIAESPKEGESIRVSLSSLDRISFLMEEIQVNKIAIDDLYLELSPDMQKKMRPRINEMHILHDSLQEEIRLLRLIPAATLLQKFPREVRDIAKDLNKDIEFFIKGDDVKIDKLVLEGLKDPILHILRNAIDHGIELPEVRLAAGKSKEGHIKINVKAEGNQIIFDIHDDGAGIDYHKVAEIALEKNIVSQSEIDNMSEVEMLDLIFRPGFSSKQVATTVSGRGVGLDIVKTNVSNLKGKVKLSTEVGKGTTFHLQVPLTLTSESGLLVRCMGQDFMIPTSHIEKVLSLPKNQIMEVEASQAILVDNHTIPLKILADVIRISHSEIYLEDQINVVVIKKGWHTVALLVDAILGEREIVIKPLQPPLTSTSCVMGGTLSSNGQVIIVLNANELVDAAFHVEATSKVSLNNEIVQSISKTSILVVDDSITTRTLEKNILETKGYQVTIAVNGKEAWDILQKQAFSLLITDVNMPIMDGFALTERVKSSPNFNKMPVIIVTSLDSESEKQRGIDVGANAYIVKNEFESGALLDIVSQLV